MGVFYEQLTPSLTAWILSQPMFWVATAPLSANGHVNVSPKGGPHFGVTSPTQFWYLDLTGSGVETISHLNEPGNGRITISFNAFDGSPKIIRLWGKGRALEFGSKEYEEFVKANTIELVTGLRAIIVVDVHQVGSSCGYSVPLYDFVGYRYGLHDFMKKRVKSDEEGNRKDGMERYWAFKNAFSMDGIPAMKRALATAAIDSVKPIKKMVGPYASQFPLQSGRNDRRSVPAWALTLAVLMSFLLGVLATLILQDDLAARDFSYNLRVGKNHSGGQIR